MYYAESLISKDVYENQVILIDEDLSQGPVNSHNYVDVLTHRHLGHIAVILN